MRTCGLILGGALMLAGCSGNPLNNVGGGGGGGGTAPDGGVNTCTSTNTICEGEVNRFTYDASTDTIQINNLPFDLGGTYQRVPALDQNGFMAFRNIDGAEVYYALYRQSATGLSETGVVGTGNYQKFGYGGSMMRATPVTGLPANGEATYQGNYAGIRVYDGTGGTSGGGLGFVTGTAFLRVDFDDFDDGGAVDAAITGRTAYDGNGAPLGALPGLGATTTSMSGSTIKQTNITEVIPGTSDVMTGTLRAMFSGPEGKEITGIVILEGPDALGSGDNVQERGGFLLDRITYVTP